MTHLKAEENHSVPAIYKTCVFAKMDKGRDVSNHYQIRSINSLFN